MGKRECKPGERSVQKLGIRISRCGWYLTVPMPLTNQVRKGLERAHWLDQKEDLWVLGRVVLVDGSQWNADWVWKGMRRSEAWLQRKESTGGLWRRMKGFVYYLFNKKHLRIFYILKGKLQWRERLEITGQKQLPVWGAWGCRTVQDPENSPGYSETYTSYCIQKGK